MDIQWRDLLRNKWALGGVGVAGLVGAAVWWQRTHGTGTTAPSSTTGTAGTTGTAYPDTTGTDLAEWLGSQEQVLAQQQQDFLDQLTSTLQGAQQIPPASGGAGTPSVWQAPPTVYALNGGNKPPPRLGGPVTIKKT